MDVEAIKARIRQAKTGEHYEDGCDISEARQLLADDAEQLLHDVDSLRAEVTLLRAANATLIEERDAARRQAHIAVDGVTYVPEKPWQR